MEKWKEIRSKEWEKVHAYHDKCSNVKEKIIHEKESGRKINMKIVLNGGIRVASSCNWMRCNAVPYRTVQCNAFCFGKTTWCEFRWFSLLCRCTKDEHQPNPPVSRFFEHFYANKNATKYAEWTKTKAPELCVYVLKEKENRQEEMERKKRSTNTCIPAFHRSMECELQPLHKFNHLNEICAQLFVENVYVCVSVCMDV